MTLENIEIIYEWNLNELWAYVEAYSEDLHPEEQQTLNNIKEGYKIKIHINYLIDGHYEEHPDEGLVIIKKMKMPINKIWDEIQTRKNKLRKIIIEMNEKEEIYTAR